MLNISELEFIKSLINTYKDLGYRNYIVHTVTDLNKTNDLVIYLSKDIINADTDMSFTLSENSIKIELDTTKDYTSLIRKQNVSSFSGYLQVSTNEYVYTNSNTSYSCSDFVINPNLELSNTNSKTDIEYSLVIVSLLSIIFLYTFIRDILRIGNRR